MIEADVRWPTDAGLAADGVRALAREGRKLAAKVSEKRTAVRDRTRSMGRKLRTLTRTIRKRTGEAKREVLALTEQTGELLEASIKEARSSRGPLGGERVAAAHKGNRRPRRRWRSSPTAARRSPDRSSSASRASRSRTG